MFYDFPKDKDVWEIEDQYFFGPDILVAPVLYPGERERKLYLPQGTEWRDGNSDMAYQGGQWITVPAPLDRIPYFIKKDSKVFQRESEGGK